MKLLKRLVNAIEEIAERLKTLDKIHYYLEHLPTAFCYRCKKPIIDGKITWMDENYCSEKCMEDEQKEHNKIINNK